MQVKTSELLGAALDYTVAKAERHTLIVNGTLRGRLHEGVWVAADVEDPNNWKPLSDFNYSSNWDLSGPIVERERLEIRQGNSLYFPTGNEHGEFYERLWVAESDGRRFHGQTLLMAALRCYCFIKLGDTVEVPDELIF